VSGNLIIDGWPVTPKALLADPPPEVMREVALKPSLRKIRDATVRLAQIKRQRDIEASDRIILENKETEFKAVDGLGELKARIPMRVFLEMRRRCGTDYWAHPENIDEFLQNNPQYGVKISRGTRGQEYAGKK
jgi:hypothetical protein